MRYVVPVESAEYEDQEIVHADCVTISGKPKHRAKMFRRYLRERWGIWKYEQQSRIIRLMNFTDLL